MTAQLVAAVIYCLFSSGVVFGYAALKPVLKDEGAYDDVCHGDDTCVEIHLNLMFTVAAVATNVAALPIGAILDHYGPRVCGCAGAAFLSAGSVVLSFAKVLPFDGFLLGYFLLALGGPFIYISSFQLSNAFPRRSGLILALLTGAFDASSALFLVYRLAYEHTGGRFGHRQFFLAYLAVPALVVALQLALMPAQSYKTVGEIIEDMEECCDDADADAAVVYDIYDPCDPTPLDEAVIIDDQVDEETALLRAERREHRQHVVHEVEELLGPAAEDGEVRREAAKYEASGVWGVMHGAGIGAQLRSPWFWLVCLFTVVQMTRINYFVATIRPQYERLLGSAGAAARLNTFFDAALPLGGLLSIPLVGAVLDHLRTTTVLASLVGVATAIGALGVVPRSPAAAYANVVLFVLYRPFYYTAVSDYSAKVFGFRTFGTVYGAVICLAGLFNFSQSALDYLFHRAFAGDPVPVNLMLLALGLVTGLALVGFVAHHVRRSQRGRRRRSSAGRGAGGGGRRGGGKRAGRVTAREV